MKKIVIATKNAGKVREMKDAFAHLPVEVVASSEFGQLPNAIEDGETFAENAAIKKAVKGITRKKNSLPMNEGYATWLNSVKIMAEGATPKVTQSANESNSRPNLPLTPSARAIFPSKKSKRAPSRMKKNAS